MSKKPKTIVYVYDLTEDDQVVFSSLLEGGVSWKGTQMLSPLQILKTAYQQKIKIWPKSLLEKKGVENKDEKPNT